MDIEDSEKYELDIKRTLISNIPCIVYLLLVGIFVVKCAGFLTTLESQEVRLIGGMVYMFSVVRLMGWSIGMPNLEYRPIVTYGKLDTGLVD